MKWEGLNLHLENLLPGLVSLYLLLGLVTIETNKILSNDILKILNSNQFIISGVFISGVYLLGVISVAISRFLIDRISEYSLRPLLLKIFPKGGLKGKSIKEINVIYRNAIKKTFSSKNETVINEIIKRRERGRLIRTTLFPVIFSMIYLSIGLIWSIVTVLFIIFSYAYIENTIYEESLLIVIPKGTVPDIN